MEELSPSLDPQMNPNETTRLFLRARGGSSDALDALCRRCAGKLLPLIRLRMGRTLRAELESRDILQAVMLKSFQRLAHVQDPGALLGWMSRIAENEIRDRADYLQRRRRDAAVRVPLADAADVPSPVREALSDLIMNEALERLERALESLPEPQREVIILRKLQELTFPEIAMRLGKSEDACRMQFARAMTALTLMLQKDG
jgi:RNA polymerase sigma-70 factor, ECF subfamily